MNKDTFLDRYHADYWKSRTGTSVTVLSKLARNMGFISQRV